MNKITVEIANSISTRCAGLMYRSSLDANAGMFFDFDNSGTLSFWGSNTYIPLDVAFIDKDFKIASINKIVPLSTKAVRSETSCKYALEVNANFFINHNISVGDYVSLEGNELTFISDKKGK
jgi:uncharacterized membrane protein (UPF0127 family)